MKHGKRDDSGGNRNGQPARVRPVASVAERPIVARKPGNAGGAKGPQFKDQRTQEQGTG